MYTVNVSLDDVEKYPAPTFFFILIDITLGSVIGKKPFADELPHVIRVLEIFLKTLRERFVIHDDVF